MVLYLRDTSDSRRGNRYTHLAAIFSLTEFAQRHYNELRSSATIHHIMYQKTVLDNGLRILTHSLPVARSVSACVFVGSGSRYEEDDQAGISHFLEHMLFKGTPKRPSSPDISGAIEQVGGIMNGGTDHEATSYWCKVAQIHFHTAIDVLADMVRNPILDSGEVEKERSVVQEELSMSNDYPNYRVDMLIDEMLWPNQPMGRDIGGSKESVQGISRQALLEWFQAQYGASNVVISVAGDISHEGVLEALSPYLDDWPKGNPLPWRPADHGERESPEVRVEYRKTEQAHLCLALPGISTLHPDRYALDMMSTVLGEGMSSRLFLEVREKRGLAYDIHSTVSHFKDTGAISIFCGVDPKKAQYTIETILGELQRIKEGVPEEELSRARELTKGRLLLSMEDSRSVASWAGAQELLYQHIRTVDDVIAKVDAVVPEDVEKVANEFLLPEKIRLAVVGPYRSDRRFVDLLEV